jgi:hypothetical protein
VVRLSGDALAAGLIVFALYRYGWFSAIVAIYFLHLMIFFPITLTSRRGMPPTSCWP